MQKYVLVILWTPMYYGLYSLFIDINMIRIELQYVNMKITYAYGHTTIVYVTNACVII